MRVVLFLAAAVFMGSTQAFAQVVEECVPAAVIDASAGASHVPLVRLGALIGASLPLPAQIVPLAAATAAGVPAAPAIPAISDTGRAQAILLRAQALPAPAPAAAPAADAAATSAREEPRRSPQEVLAAVNSVLKGVSPEQLGRMSDADLRDLSETILDQMQGARSRADSQSGLAVLARARLEALRSMPHERVILNPARGIDAEEKVVVKGLPPQARLAPTGATVYRHYTTKEGLRSILASKGIWNGFLSHIDLTKGVSRETHVHLTGVFFTTPERDAANEDVLAHDAPYFVDVRIPEGLPLLETQAGKKFLIPLPARTIGWVRDAYRKWIEGGSDPSSVARNLDREGGPGPELTVPVEIVGHGLVGKNRRAYWTDAALRGLPPIPADVGASLDRQRLREILAAPELDTDALFSELQKDPFLSEQLAIPTVAEGYTGVEHAEAVLGVFEKFFDAQAAARILPPTWDRGFARLVWALHDIGKARAFQEGDLSQQHAHAVEIMRPVLGHMGYAPEPVRIALALVDGDPLGSYLQDEPGHDAKAAAAQIRRMAASAGLTEENFFKLLVAFYQSDAGSYTAWGAGQRSLEHLFDMDARKPALAFSPHVQSKLSALENELARTR
jgi:hypothetical protein